MTTEKYITGKQKGQTSASSHHQPVTYFCSQIIMSEASGSTFLEFLLCGVERWDSENGEEGGKMLFNERT